MNIKKHHVLLIAALAILGLSACDKSKSPDEGTPPAAKESAMPESDNAKDAADDGMNKMKEDMSDSMDDMMDQMGNAAEDAMDDAEESMSEAAGKLKQ